MDDPAARKIRSRRAYSRDREMTLPAILAAAEIEFATNGFTAARTENIAARAKVVKGMIFHYFKSKESLYEAVLERAFKPLAAALDKTADRNQTATSALLSSIRSLLGAMNDQPLSPVIFMLESIQGGGEHVRKLGMFSLYTRIEALLKKGIAAGEFRAMDPWHGAVNIVGLCGFYYCAANNFAHARKGPKALSQAALKKHAEEVVALIKRGVTRTS